MVHFFVKLFPFKRIPTFHLRAFIWGEGFLVAWVVWFNLSLPLCDQWRGLPQWYA